MLPKSYPYPVYPEQYSDVESRMAKPVQRRSLPDGGVLTCALRIFPLDKERHAINWQERLDLYTKTYDFGRVLWPHRMFVESSDFKEMVEEISRRGLYIFDICGYVPSFESANSVVGEKIVKDDIHNFLLEKLGDRFWGWDNGEQDGRYIGTYAPMICPAPADRKEAYRHFCRFFEKLSDQNKNYLTALNSLTYSHYFAHQGDHMLLGAETAQLLPNVNMWYSFIRGAGKQYGLMWFGNVSIYTRTGYKRYDAEYEGRDIAPWDRVSGYGPDKGTSLSLMRRLWFVEVMYGSILMGIEQEHFYKDTHADDGDNRELAKKKRAPVLTPIGRLHLKCADWCKQHPDLGVQHTPAALIIDFHTGWAPPRHLYSQTPYTIWGNMPYEKSDHQIDLFFRRIFPGYEDAGYYKDERGFLAPSPYGDSFDVLMSNATEEVLAQYSIAFILGRTQIQGRLAERLKKWVQNGGKLITSAANVPSEIEELFGWKHGGWAYAASAINPSGEETKEGRYRYMCLENIQGETLLSTDTGDPLMVKHTYGKGETYTISAEYGIAENPEYTTYEDGVIRNPWDWADTERPLSSPYKNMESIWRVIGELITSAQPLVIEGRDIEKIINVTEDPRVYYVLLSNQGREETTISIKPAKGTFKNIRNLLEEEDIDLLEENKTYLHLMPQDATILRVECTEPCTNILHKSAKISVDKNIEEPQTKTKLSDQIKLASESGFAGLQVSLKDIRNLTDQEIQTLKKEAQERGIPITTLWAVSDMTPYLDVDINSEVSHDEALVEEYFRMLVSTGERLEVSHIAISGGFGIEYVSVKSNPQIIINRLKRLAEMGRKKGQEIIFVPHHHRKGKTGAEAAYMARKSGIKCALDTGHAALYGDNLKEAILASSDRLECIYLNSPITAGQVPTDAHRLPSAEEATWQSIGELAKTLETAGYAGRFCINPGRAYCTAEALIKERERLEREFGITRLELCVL